MRPRFLSSRLRYLFPAVLLLLSMGSGGTFSLAQPRPRRTDSTKYLDRMKIPGTQDLQLIVELTDPALLERLLGNVSSRQLAATRALSERNPKVDFSSAQALANREQIRLNKESMKSRILQFSGARVLGTTDTLLNTVIVRVPAVHYQEIRNLPGVKKVYFSRPRRMLLDQAAIIQNAQGMWSWVGGQTSAGQGIKIGIVDSGIDIKNPMFSGTGFKAPSGFPKYDNSADKAFTNQKIIVARSYVSLLSDNSQPIQTAQDEVGHGTFVAGCAAGDPVSTPLVTSISGMAPGAFLGSYKIFGDPTLNPSTTSAAEIAGIDAAVSDGMDVISLSLGSLDYLPPDEDPEYQEITNAITAGVVVTIAAGNSGPTTHTIGSPGAIPDAITVGSVTNSRTFGPSLRTTSSSLSAIAYVSSADGVQVTPAIPLTKIVDVASLDGTGLGCSILPAGSLSGDIALMERGTCDFSVKASYAAQAGAGAVVIYDNVSESLFSISGLSTVSIPAVLISMSDGVALKQYIDANPSQAEVSIDVYTALSTIPQTARVVSSFSSVGPGPDFSIKPDLVAVGENVYSAVEQTLTTGEMYDPSGFQVDSGTSFATPMVAGAAAVLRQHFPSLGPLAIKSLLTTMASRNLTVDGTNPANVLEAGSGLLDMGTAIAAGAVFSPTSLSFGVSSYSGTLSLPAQTLTIQNISSSSDQFTIGIEPIVAGPTITLSNTSTGPVAAGSSATVDISMQITAPNTGGFQGFITVTSASTQFVYRIPYWAGLYVPDTTTVLQVSQDGSNPYTSLDNAIAAAQPGNIIEIEDSSTYTGVEDGYIVSTNGQGLPLHGLTIRAGSGEAPVIQADSSGIGIQVAGLQNVLLQGLQISGGYNGIELLQPYPTVPLSATVDSCTISGAASDGLFIDGGGTIDITNSTIQNSSGAGIDSGYYAPTYDYNKGTQLAVINSTIQNNSSDGLDAYYSNVQILNSAFSTNYGYGVNLQTSTGTVSGNTISQNQYYEDQYGDIYYGDALQIYDGNINANNNLSTQNTGAGLVITGSVGPTAQISGNTMTSNGDYGIYSDLSLSVLVDGNFIDNNFGGTIFAAAANALLTNNIIAGSTDASYGEGSGVEIYTGSNARLVNDTIYGNALYGVLSDSGASVSVANSIVSSNGSGNLGGSIAPQSSLTNNKNPDFTNSASGTFTLAGDFSLAPGSPAINSGSTTVANLPFLDYNGQLRVPSSTVDVGAIETNSAYPLVYPLSVYQTGNTSDPTIGGPFNTGIAFINPNSAQAQFNFTAYNASGAELDSASASLGIEAQEPIMDYQLFGFSPPVISSILGTSDQKPAGFFTLADPGYSKFATGANASTSAAVDLVFMRHQSSSGRNTSYAIFNPGVNSANVTATLYASDGSSAANHTAVIPAKGRTILQFTDAIATGYLRVQSDRPITGVELVGSQTVVAALSAASPDSQAQLFFPQFAVGGNESTEIGIVNTSSSPANLTLNAYDNSGNLLGSVQYTASNGNALPAGGQVMQTMTDLFGFPSTSPTTLTGYLVAQSDQPGLMGYTGFEINNGTTSADATVPANSIPSQRLFFSQIANEIPAGTGVTERTGVALLNPLGVAVAYQITVYDKNGNVVAQANNTLGPHEKVAKYLAWPGVPDSSFFTQDLTMSNGHIEVTSEYGLIGLELFFTDDFSQIASVPAQTGD